MTEAGLNNPLATAENIAFSRDAAEFLDAIERRETDGISCWRSPLVERRQGSSIEGVGLFATNDIPENTLLAIKQGRVINTLTLKSHAEIIRGSQQQIGHNSFLAGLTPEEVDRNLIGFNHSHDPNARMVLFKGVPLAFLVSECPISTGKEVTVNYSLTQQTSTHFIEECHCGAANCRGYVMPRWDWLDPEFQKQNEGKFAWYIQNDIDSERAISSQKGGLVSKLHREHYMAAWLIAQTTKEITRIESDMAQSMDFLCEQMPLGTHRFLLPYLNRKISHRLEALKGQRLEATVLFCLTSIFDRNMEEILGIIPRRLFVAGSSEDEQAAALNVFKAKVNENMPTLIQFASKMDEIFN